MIRVLAPIPDMMPLIRAQFWTRIGGSEARR
jgi:hypothetical protein